MLRHRLNSIYYDKLELDRLFEKFPQIPVVANLRCGSWYCDTDKNRTCYFKSTDGHDKQWDFNIRRLNTHFLEFIYTHNTVFVVDSTGNSAKVYPDALSKTIPIWATVMNRLFCADGADGDSSSVILPDVISERESRELRETVERKINDWVELAKSVLPEHLLELTKQKDNKPKKIIPIFVSSRDSFDASVLMDDSTIKIICVSASSSNSSHTDDTYILGAGDDEEMWSHGLTAEMFWKQPGDFLRHTTDTELKAYIREIMRFTTNDESSIQNEVMNDPIYGQISVSTTTDMSGISITCDTQTITLNYDMKIKNVVYDLMCCLHNLYTKSHAKIHISGGNPDINIAVSCAIAIFNYRYNTSGNTITKAFIRNLICRICSAADDFKLFPRRYCRELNTFFISRDIHIL